MDGVLQGVARCRHFVLFILIDGICKPGSGGSACAASEKVLQRSSWKKTRTLVVSLHPSEQGVVDVGVRAAALDMAPLHTELRELAVTVRTLDMS